MRRLSRWLLLGLAFSIPWEYSADLGPPLGDIARVLGLVLLLSITLALLQARSIRRLHSLHWLLLALLAWSAASYFWSVDGHATVVQLRGYVQEIAIAWFVWELIDTPGELRDLLRCYVAGCCILAGLTLANFISPDVAGQIRFAAEGQDPNDVARFLDLGLPLGALLVSGQSPRRDKVLALSYMPLGLLGVLLTASRSGLIATFVAVGGCGILLARGRLRGAFAIFLPAVLVLFGIAAPQGTIDRILSTPQALMNLDFNQRLSIWTAGWQAVVHSPLVGAGAGTFLSATHLPQDVTAHNTALAIVVEGGVIALFMATAILAVLAVALRQLHGNLRWGLATGFLVWLVNALVLSIQTNRTTWLLMGMIATAGRLAMENPKETVRAFPEPTAASAGGRFVIAAE